MSIHLGPAYCITSQRNNATTVLHKSAPLSSATKKKTPCCCQNGSIYISPRNRRDIRSSRRLIALAPAGARGLRKQAPPQTAPGEQRYTHTRCEWKSQMPPVGARDIQTAKTRPRSVRLGLNRCKRARRKRFALASESFGHAARGRGL